MDISTSCASTPMSSGTSSKRNVPPPKRAKHKQPMETAPYTFEAVITRAAIVHRLSPEPRCWYETLEDTEARIFSRFKHPPRHGKQQTTRRTLGPRAISV